MPRTTQQAIVALNGVLGGPAMPLNPALYCGLYNVPPSIFNEGVEVSGVGTGYYRANIVNTGISFSTATTQGTIPAVCNNIASIVFPQASFSWGTITALAIHSQSTGTGNMLYFGSLPVPRNVLNGDSVRVPPNGLAFFGF